MRLSVYLPSARVIQLQGIGKLDHSSESLVRCVFPGPEVVKNVAQSVHVFSVRPRVYREEGRYVCAWRGEVLTLAAHQHIGDRSPHVLVFSTGSFGPVTLSAPITIS